MKVPFGYHLDTKKYIGIDEAKNGLKCGCICPSCDMKLKARQGQENEHHFAHHEKSKTDCRYSFWVAVRSMAKQKIKENKKILHQINKIDIFPVVPWRNSSGMYIKDLIISPHIKEYQFDVKVVSSWGIFYIYFITPSDEDSGRKRGHYHFIGRRNTFNPYLVLEIDIRKARQHKNKATTYLSSLLNDNLNKKWFSSHTSYLDYIKEKDISDIKEVSKISYAQRYIVKNQNTYVPEKHTLKEPLLGTTQEVLDNIGLSLKSALPDTIKAINNMSIFYYEMSKNINKSRDDALYDCIEIYRCENFWFFGCYGDFYCIAHIGGSYIVYTLEENKIKILLRNRHHWKLIRLLREYCSGKAKDLF